MPKKTKTRTAAEELDASARSSGQPGAAAPEDATWVFSMCERFDLRFQQIGQAVAPGLSGEPRRLDQPLETSRTEELYLHRSLAVEVPTMESNKNIMMVDGRPVMVPFCGEPISFQCPWSQHYMYFVSHDICASSDPGVDPHA
jgi:hypothetical protein